MDIKNIKALVDLMNQGRLTSLEVCEGETKIRLEREASRQDAPPATPVSEMKRDSGEEPVSDAELSVSEPGGRALDFNNLTEVRSPIVGVYYSAPAPDADPFVSIGSKIKKGDVLCIIETMKLMNEITSEHDGEIADICVKNGDIVEFGQVLFKIF